MAYAHPESVIEVLWRPAARGAPPQVFAILDGAREERIYPAIEKLDDEEQYCCLYRGELDADLASAAPYLVRLERDAELTIWLATYGFGDSWGVFLHSGAALDELRRHFRRFLMVYDHTGKPLYFRYYDPRVLRVFLPTCTPMEQQTMFGPVRSYFAEAEDATALLEFTVQDGRVVRSEHPLTTAAATAP
jgi:hypothetical protein